MELVQMTSTKKVELLQEIILALEDKEYNKDIMPSCLIKAFDDIKLLRAEKEKMNSMEYLAKMQLIYVNINTYICTEIDPTLNYAI